MKISIFGAGYVGITSAACLSELGHKVVCIDVNPIKIRLINRGNSPIEEKNLKRLVKNNWREGRIWATNDPKKAISESDVSMICVGTPIDTQGRADLTSVFSVFQTIGKELRNKKNYHLVILRSTSPPGTTRRGLKIVEESSGKSLGSNFGGCMNPEFLRGWSLFDDFYNPPFVLIGQYDKKSGDLAESLYKNIRADTIRTDLEIAEIVKYACNTFHALKISFANEVGRLCKQHRIDAREVMEIFVKDQKLNLSSSYLRPGFAFGGSCLPKDVQAMSTLSKEIGVNTPIFDSILISNDIHIDYAVDLIKKTKSRRVGIIGLSYHENTDDLRGSQVIELVMRLIQNGFEILVYDDNVKLRKLIGSNKDYVTSLPFDLEEIMISSMEKLIEKADVLVIAHKRADLKNLLNNIPQNKYVIDLVNLYESRAEAEKIKNYEGICW